MRLLDVRPGVTDLASLVFSDEGDILKGSDNPDLLYNQGVAQATVGRLEDARASFRRVLELAPDRRDARENLESLPPAKAPDVGKGPR